MTFRGEYNSILTEYKKLLDKGDYIKAGVDKEYIISSIAAIEGGVNELSEYEKLNEQITESGLDNITADVLPRQKYLFAYIAHKLNRWKVQIQQTKKLISSTE